MERIPHGPKLRQAQACASSQNPGHRRARYFASQFWTMNRGGAVVGGGVAEDQEFLAVGGDVEDAEARGEGMDLEERRRLT